MIRLFVFLMIALVAITFLVSIGGILLKVLSGNSQPPPRPTPGGVPPDAAGGTLQRDPVCGTYVPVSSSFHKNVKGQPVYFCSANCRDTYVA